MSEATPPRNGRMPWQLIALAISTFFNAALLVMGVYLEARMDARTAVLETLMKDRMGMPERAKALESRSDQHERELERLNRTMDWIMQNVVSSNDD